MAPAGLIVGYAAIGLGVAPGIVVAVLAASLS
jgi:hypothetical protein